MRNESCDIFCNVVDNYGDIGVCWRLARQLANEHDLAVRLWVDDLGSFAKLCPEADAALEKQKCCGVEVYLWRKEFPGVQPAELVIEAFACALPPSYVAAMAAQAHKSVWINLEYLSAEEWVAGCHGLASPHPFLPLVKYFFFPGFTANTGGVLIERGLTRRRQAFQCDTAAMRQFLDGLGVRTGAQGEVLVSLFSYAQAPIKALLEACAAGSLPITVISFDGTPGAQALSAFGVGRGRRRGALAGEILPFLSQDDYDRVLWVCGWNFVRGEDSFVRAQLAGRPPVWQAYPQPGNTHSIKLQAFLDRYPGSGDSRQRPLDSLWRSWNGLAPSEGLAAAWADCMKDRAQLEDTAGQWATQLEALGGLAGNLAQFCMERL